MKETDIRKLEELNLARPKTACCAPTNIKKADRELIELLSQFKRPTSS